MVAASDAREVRGGDVLRCPLFALADLPAPTTVELRAEGLAASVWLTTSRRVAEALGRAGRCVCTPLEYELLAAALADGAATRAHALACLGRKARDRRFRLTRGAVAGAVARFDGDGRSWTVGDLVEALGAELLRVEVGEGRA